LDTLRCTSGRRPVRNIGNAGHFRQRRKDFGVSGDQVPEEGERERRVIKRAMRSKLMRFGDEGEALGIGIKCCREVSPIICLHRRRSCLKRSRRGEDCCQGRKDRPT
jgi:hypothetical protein